MNMHGKRTCKQAAGCAAGLLLAIAAGAGCGLFRGPEEHMRRGNRHFEAGRFDKAAVEYMNVVRAQPTNATALLRLGLSCFELGEARQAFSALLRARACGAQSREMSLKLGALYLWGARPAEARREIVAALEQGPADINALSLLADASRAPDEIQDARRMIRAHAGEFGDRAAYHIALGMLEVRSGDLDGAARAYEAAVATDPQSAEGHMRMAGLYDARGDTNRAETAFARAAELAPDDPIVLLRRASFKAGRGQPEESRRMLEEAVAAAPDFEAGRLGLAGLAIQEGRLDDALTICATVLKRNSGNLQARLLRARIHLARNETEAAAAECRRVLDAQPGAADALYVLALTNLRTGSTPKAIALLSQAASDNPDYAAAVILLAELQLQAGRPDEVMALLPAFIARYPRLPRPYVTLGAAYRAAGKADEEIALFRSMVEAFPDDARSLHLLGASLLAAGREAEAEAQFAAALGLQPGFVDPLAMLADRDMEQRKDFDAATQRVERQIRLAPDEPRLYDLLGRVRLAARDPDGAETALKKSLELRPDSVGTLMALSRVYSGSAKQDEALASLDRALAVNSNHLPALAMSSSLLLRKERVDEAQARLERLLALDPKSVVAANNLAYVYADMRNDLERAYPLAARARALAPHDPYVADTFGWILCRRGEWKPGLLALRESAARLDKQPDVLYHAAVCRAALGDETGARAHIGRALLARPEFPDAARLAAVLDVDPAALDDEGRRTLADASGNPLLAIPALARLGIVAELEDGAAAAREAYGKALALNPDHPAALLGMARLRAAEGAAAAVLDLARKAREAAPDDPATGLEAGRLALRNGDARWALAVLRDVGVRMEDNPEAQYRLAAARFYAGQIAEARGLAQRALASSEPFGARAEAGLFAAAVTLWLDPEAAEEALAGKASEAERSAGADWLPALLLRARGQALRKDAAGERAALERVLAVAPDFAPGMLRLAGLYAARPRDEAQAYKLAVRAREMLPADPAAARLLGRLAYGRKDARWAGQLLAEALKADPRDAEAAFYLGLSQYQLGDKDEARRLLEQALAARADFPEIDRARDILAEPR
ncbi:MAG: tetratricopeptide repeat protein [Lentisphaerae bacterium]|nr:tetratricopeptide repeat protein [Lentisphaerota bacterium]